MPDSLTSNLTGNAPPSAASAAMSGPAWRSLPWVGLLLLALASLWPTLAALVHLWRTIDDYDYCFVIALICVVWIGREISRLPAQTLAPPASRWLWWGALLVLCLLEYVLTQGSSDMGAQMLIPPILSVVVITLLGWHTAKPLMAPIFYFYFAIPVWDQAMPLLQQVTIYGAKWSMQLAGIAVTVSGDMITIPEGAFQVLYACSGVRYWVVSLALATLMLTMDRVPLRRWPLALLLVTGLSIVANCVRVFTVMYAGHVTGMRHYFVSDNHKGLGQAIFVVLLIVIFWVLGRLRPANVAGPAAAVAPTIADTSRPVFTAPAIWLATALVLVGMGALTLRAQHAEAIAAAPQIQPLPLAVGPWQGPLPSQSVWLPKFADAADSRRLAYRSAAGQVEVYLNVYGLQSQGHELVFFDNTVYAPGHWQLVDADLGNGLRAALGLEPVLTEQVTESGERWLVGQLYVVGGHRTATGVFAQAWYGLSTLQHPAPAGLIALAVQCGERCDAARGVLNDFWRTQGEALVTAIPANMG